MKRKLIFSLGILLFLGFVSVNCSAQSSTNDQRIVGTWVGTYNGKTDTYVFNANGSGTNTYDGKNYNFTYGVSIDGVIRIIADDYDETYKIYFSPDGRTLIFDKNIYRKK